MSGLVLKILNMSLAGGIIIIVVLLARLLLRRAPKWTRLVLWGIVALRLAVPVFVQSPLSLMPRAAEIDLSAARTEPQAVTQPQTVDEIQLFPRTELPTETVHAASPRPAENAGTAEPSSGKRSVNGLELVSFVWLAGAAGMLAYALISRAVLGRRLAAAVRTDGDVYEAEGVKTPFLLGIFRPTVYLPFGMDSRERELVLLHERAHVRGLDHLFKPLGWALLSAHWFNPLVWLAFALFSKDIELACDERVIRSLDGNARADYSQTLLNLSVNRRRIAACPLAFGESNVKERVKNVLNYKKPTLWIILAAALVTLFITGCFLTSPKDDKPTENEPVFESVEAVLAFARENGWVAVGPDYSFICGESVWNDFVHDVNEKEPSEVTVVTVGAGAILADSDKKAFGGENVTLVQIKKVDYDGNGFDVCARYPNETEFGDEREYKYLDRFSLDGEYNYALMNEPLDELTRTDTYLLLSGDVYPLFTLIPAADPADAENTPDPGTDDGPTWPELTDTPEYNAWLDEYLSAEAWELAERAMAAHKVKLSRDTCNIQRIEHTRDFAVTYTDEADTMVFRAIFTSDGDSRIPCANLGSCILAVSAPTSVDGQKAMSDLEAVTPREGDIYLDNTAGAPVDYMTAAKSAAAGFANRFMYCSAKNYFRCEEAYAAEFVQPDPNNERSYLVRLVLRPVNEWFSGYFAGCIGTLYEGADHPEWTGWYTLWFKLTLERDDPQHFFVTAGWDE